MENMIRDLIIIGGGPAGLTAALYAKRAGLDVLLIEKYSVGGQAALTPTIENYPGFLSISGFELGMKIHEQIEKLGVETIFEDVIGVSLSGKVKTVKTSQNVYEAKSVIIATGASAKMLSLDGEKKLIGKGISYCAVCDGAFFRGKTVAVVGGGNTALEDSMYLSKFAKKVYLIHRRDKFKGDQILVDEVLEKVKSSQGSFELVLDSEVKKICGDQSLEKVIIQNTKTKKESQLKLDGLFIAIGRKPDTEIFANEIKLDQSNYIEVDENARTNLEGVFACGDVTNGKLKQIITACAQGAIAGNNAGAYLSKLK